MVSVDVLIISYLYQFVAPDIRTITPISLHHCPVSTSSKNNERMLRLTMHMHSGRLSGKQPCRVGTRGPVFLSFCLSSQVPIRITNFLSGIGTCGNKSRLVFFVLFFCVESGDRQTRCYIRTFRSSQDM